MNPIKVIINRIFLMVIGLFVSSLGVSFSLKAQIGTTPIACCPAVFSIPLNISIGTAMWVMCILFVFAQIIIGKKDFKPFQLLQMVVVITFGVFTDFTYSLISALTAETVFDMILYCLVGIFLLAFGLYLLLASDLLMLSPDAMLLLLSKKYDHDYGKIKIIMDASMVVIAAIGSLIMYKKLLNIGIGTLLAAIFVGLIIRKLKAIQSLNVFLNRLTKPDFEDIEGTP